MPGWKVRARGMSDGGERRRPACPADVDLGPGVSFVASDRDLMAKSGALVDSWYVNCAVVTCRKTVGFLWHQEFPAKGCDARFMGAAARRTGGRPAHA